MHRVSFQQVHYFLTVANYLNFTEASKSLYITQPALSKQIFSLEKELGFSLFNRNKRSVSLTPSGEYLYKEWLNLADVIDSSIQHAKQLSHTISGELNIGIVDTFNCDETLAALIAIFREKYPNISINLESYSFKELRERFHANELDIILIPVFELDTYKNVDWVPFQETQLAIAIPTSNPLSQQEIVTMEDLRDQPFVVISPKESPNGIEKIKLACRAYGFEPNIVKYATNLSSLMLAIKNGYGVSICHNRILDDKKIKMYDYNSGQNDTDIVAAWKLSKTSLEVNFFKSEMYKLKNIPLD